MAIYKLHAQGKNKSKDDTESSALHVHEHVIIELIAASLEHKGFLAVSNALVNELARHLQCERVSLRMNRGRQKAPHAVSSSASINPESQHINLITAVMDEALDQKSTIVFPQPNEDELLITTAHANLANRHPPKALCTVLLSHMHEIIGVISLERSPDKAFDKDTILFCERVALLVGPLLLLKYEEEYWIFERVWGGLKQQWARLTGDGYYSEKAIYGFCIVAFVFLSFANGMHRVSGDALLEGKVQRVVTAAVDGFISEVHVRAGDIVKSGQLMAQLDDRELKLQKMKLQGEYDNYSREYRDARAKHDLTQVSITSAKMQQAKAELGITKEQLKRLRMNAPFDGVVVEGKLEQALGSPVERGQVLLKVAPLNDYRIILKIDDRDIAWVELQQAGHLVLASLPDVVMPFRVINITPVSIAEGGRNYFKIEAQLEQKNKLLRPGMHGLAKIDVGERKLIWIWFHRFTDRLRYTLWSW